MSGENAPIINNNSAPAQDLILYRLNEMEKITKERFDKIDDKLEHMSEKFLPRTEAEKMVNDAAGAAAKDLKNFRDDVEKRFENYKWAVRALATACIGLGATLVGSLINK